MFVFVPVSVPTQLTKVKTDARFAAADPWNKNRACAFTLDSYLVTLRGVKSVPEGTRAGSGGFHRALRSEADGITRFLPESLIELWLTKQVPMEALPALLKHIEPSLGKSDYKPILRSLSMKIFSIVEIIFSAALVIISMIAALMIHAPWWLAAVIVAGTAGVCWLFLYLVFFRMLFRRKQQMQGLLKRFLAGSSNPPEPEDSAAREWEALKTFLEQPPIAPVPPRDPLISPQPMPLAAVVRDTMLAGKAIQLYLYPLPKGPQTSEPSAPKNFSFDSILDVPEMIQPSIESRLRKAFPEIKWQDHAENGDKVRILGKSRETPPRAVVSILRKDSPGPFKLGITLSAPDESEAVTSFKEMIKRLERALTGWSIFNLPAFKTRPPSGISIDRKEMVDLVFPVEHPRVKLIGPNAVILLSRNLLEALSAHGEILDSRAKNPKEYPGSYDEESRLAGMRGARARVILGKAVPARSGEDLEMQLALDREAQYLVGELLENGWAQVDLPGTPPVSLRRIQVSFFGSRMAPTVGFGFISYSAADAELGALGELLRLDWWVS